GRSRRSDVQHQLASGFTSRGASGGPCDSTRWQRTLRQPRARLTERYTAPTAAVVVIGNEVLSGKVTDANTPFFIEQLRGLGVRLSRVAMIEDDIETIAAEVRAASKRFDWVFTTGGLGPTHDDVTMAAIARAFDCELTQSPELTAMLDNIRGKRPVDVLMRLTWIPSRASLFHGTDGSMRWPIVHVDNVYIFPGVPSFLRSKFAALRPLLAARPFVSGFVDCAQSEAEIVDAIDQTDAGFVHVDLGSYPQFGDEDHKTHLTFDAMDGNDVDQAIDHFLSLVSEAQIVRVVRRASQA
ncbi:MAG: molybdenum cofactor synthesis domain-containing protein, partial [Myxococcota bacterium]